MVKTTETPKKEVTQELMHLSLHMEFSWIAALIRFRINELCGIEQENSLPDLPPLQHGVHPYFDELILNEVSVVERIALSVAFAAHTVPYYLDGLYTKNKDSDRIFSEFGILEGEGDFKMKPTWQTVFFLSHGSNTQAQFQMTEFMHGDHRLYKSKLFVMPMEKVTNPFLIPLELNRDALFKWIYQSRVRNLADEYFPAHEITSNLDWNDLVIGEETERGLNQLRMWLRHGEKLMQHEKLSKYVNKGIRVLFYGPSGTGKTLTASLLGKEFDLPVYRVDLSQMVSKWIGETEKNLARVFDMAEKQGWILFFDEAESLFSSRGEVNNANDRRANQEVSYLLQRVENFDGTIIMATNLRDNMDEAFVRRFQLMIHFPVPDVETRARLWENLLVDTFPMAEDISFSKLAEEFEITGGTMKNAFRTVMLEVCDMPLEEQQITKADLYRAVRYECSKDGVYTIFRNY
ncbi:MAG: ATP-binding protein [Fluviicola sp.]